MEKIKLVKKYAVRHDIIIETASYIIVSEKRAKTLRKQGYVENPQSKITDKTTTKNR